MKEKGSIENLYQLDGQVPLLKAIPFGLQHILAMFVSNLTPITLIGVASGLDQSQIAFLLQNAMFVAGIATLIQLFPVWKIFVLFLCVKSHKISLSETIRCTK